MQDRAKKVEIQPKSLIIVDSPPNRSDLLLS